MTETIKVRPKSGGSVRINTPSRSIVITGVTEVTKDVYDNYLVDLVDVVVAPEKHVYRKREIKETLDGGE